MFSCRVCALWFGAGSGVPGMRRAWAGNHSVVRKFVRRVLPVSVHRDAKIVRNAKTLPWNFFLAGLLRVRHPATRCGPESLIPCDRDRFPYAWASGSLDSVGSDDSLVSAFSPIVFTSALKSFGVGSSARSLMPKYSMNLPVVP